LVENEIFFIVGLKNLRVDINILSGHGCWRNWFNNI
jgi:hypothetical protein